MKAYLVANKNGDIYVYKHKPERFGYVNIKNKHTYTYNGNTEHIQISELVCKKLFERIPTWDDEPIEIEL